MDVRALERSTGTTRTGEHDPLKQAVESLVAVMRTEFTGRWSRQFEPHPGEEGNSEELLRQWKRRCYARLRGVDLAAIVDGYEQCVQDRAPHMPDLRELTDAIVLLDRQRKRNAEEVARVVEVAAPRFEGGISGYVAEVLGPNAQTPTAQRELAKMREALALAGSGSAAERRARLDNAVAEHAALLRQQRERGALPGPKAPGFHPDLRCAVPGCNRVGTRSLSISGGGTWYCGEHFVARRQAGNL